jgi:hypothetical protein
VQAEKNIIARIDLDMDIKMRQQVGMMMMMISGATA